MIEYRAIKIKMWEDPKVIELKPREKLIFIFLFGNWLTTPTGIYEISIKTISFYLGLSEEEVKEGIHFLIKKEMIKYDWDSSTVWVVNFYKNQPLDPNKIKGIQNWLNSNNHKPFVNDFKRRWTALNGVLRVRDKGKGLRIKDKEGTSSASPVGGTPKFSKENPQNHIALIDRYYVLKGWNHKPEYKRWVRPAQELIKTAGSKERALKALEWTCEWAKKQKWTDWVLSTCLKRFDDFINNNERVYSLEELQQLHREGKL